MRKQTNPTSSTRSDSTQSQNVFSFNFPDNAYLTYFSEDGEYELRWHGGAYIDCDYGHELRDGRDFKSQDLISVYDYEKSEITISTLADFAEECEQYIKEREAMFEDGENDE